MKVTRPSIVVGSALEAHQHAKFLDARASTGMGGMGVSWWLAKVAAGEAPRPAIKLPRCTRWRRSDVEEFWERLASVREA